jgi:hypothetical protein
MPWRVIGEEVVELRSYFCDGCGGEFEDQSKNILTQKEGSLRAEFDFGYHSSRDGERYSYSFCQDCASDILVYIGMLKRLKDATVDV